MAKRKKTGGRTKGTPNKMSVAVKDALEQAFEQIGGVAELVTWAKTHKDLFYGMWVKLLPKNVQLTGSLKLEDLVAGSQEGGGGTDE